MRQKASLAEIQIACFRLGNDLYAVDIMRIKEIVKPLKIAGIPHPPPFVEGVVNLRGMVIPVVDLRKRFGMPAAEQTPLTRYLIVKAAGMLLAFVVDDVTEVVTIDISRIKPPPRLREGDSLIGVCLVGDDMVLLLDVDSVLTADERSLLSPSVPMATDGITHSRTPDVLS